MLLIRKRRWFATAATAVAVVVMAAGASPAQAEVPDGFPICDANGMVVGTDQKCESVDWAGLVANWTEDDWAKWYGALPQCDGNGFAGPDAGLVEQAWVSTYPPVRCGPPAEDLASEYIPLGNTGAWVEVGAFDDDYYWGWLVPVVCDENGLVEGTADRAPTRDEEYRNFKNPPVFCGQDDLDDDFGTDDFSVDPNEAPWDGFVLDERLWYDYFDDTFWDDVDGGN